MDVSRFLESDSPKNIEMQQQRSRRRVIKEKIKIRNFFLFIVQRLNNALE
jgi:hypothetical protein